MQLDHGEAERSAAAICGLWRSVMAMIYTKWESLCHHPSRVVSRWGGESTVIVKGNEVYGNLRSERRPRRSSAVSQKRWTDLEPEDVAQQSADGTSKPLLACLSTGQRYLSVRTQAEQGGSATLRHWDGCRHPPGQSQFSKVFVIRDAVFPDGPGRVSFRKQQLSYPYAIEHDGMLLRSATPTTEATRAASERA